MNDALQQVPSSYIDGRFIPIPGDELVSHNPADTDEVIWAATPPAAHLDDAVAAARRALGAWSRTPLHERAAVLKRWQAVVEKNLERIAGLITDEMGKMLAESRGEAKLLADKVSITLDDVSFSRVRDYKVKAGETRSGHCRFKPYGVMAVLGPFNFPAHLPNGHFVPALLLGNTVVFKPSRHTPAVGQLIAELMHEAGVPPGVFNVIHSGKGVASRMTTHDDVDGVLLTGSWPVGRKVIEANLDRPGRMLALELGGNNPAVVMSDCHFKQAVIECVRASFATTGQRCTCIRRIIVEEPISERFIKAFCQVAEFLEPVSGRNTGPLSFMGPVVSEDSVKEVLDHQAALIDRGGSLLVEATRCGNKHGHFISPSVVEVDGFSLATDCEVFGPLVHVTVVKDLDEAIEQANATHFGLAASIFTTDDDAWEEYFHRVKAGCINRNLGTAGASSKLPFGGTGRSGNRRPAGAFSVDYCAYPVASMIETGADAAVPAGMDLEDVWDALKT